MKLLTYVLVAIALVGFGYNQFYKKDHSKSSKVSNIVQEVTPAIEEQRDKLETYSHDDFEPENVIDDVQAEEIVESLEATTEQYDQELRESSEETIKAEIDPNMYEGDYEQPIIDEISEQASSILEPYEEAEVDMALRDELDRAESEIDQEIRDFVDYEEYKETYDEEY